MHCVVALRMLQTSSGSLQQLARSSQPSGSGGGGGIFEKKALSTDKFILNVISRS